MNVTVTLPLGAGPGDIAAAVERLMVAPSVADPRALPRLRDAGIVYRREPMEGRGVRRERWQTPWETWDLGEGDCEDLAIWRAVELRRDGEAAHVAVIRSGRRTLHAVVRRGDGRIEDPTKEALKMEISDGKAMVHVGEHTPGKYNATVVWRGKSYEITVRALGDSTAAATSRATALAKQIAGNPIVAALMPPQAKAALKVAGRLAKLAKMGGKPALKAALSKLRGPGAKRLAKALGKFW